MKKSNKKLWLRLSVIVLSMILAQELLLCWKTNRVEKELADVTNLAYVRSIGQSNTAYGITSNLKELAVEAGNWISILNQYDDSVRSKSGKQIMVIKHGISNQNTITMDDLQILGCEIEFSEEELTEAIHNPMFRVIY